MSLDLGAHGAIEQHQALPQQKPEGIAARALRS
jgi:hypothetical protein